MADSIDHWDVIYPQILRDLMANGDLHDSRTGTVLESLGYEFSLNLPRSRCLQNSTRKFNVFQALGHWLWIMSGRMDYEFISFYNPTASNFSTDGHRLHGAYGPRLNGIGVYNQIERTIQMIESKPGTRRAVMPIFIPAFDRYPSRHDDEHAGEIPCPVAFHCLPRDGELHFITYMRSQNAYSLLPLDIFTFTLIQEFIATSAGLSVGRYKHYTGSFHVYEEDFENAQTTIETADGDSGLLMPEMKSELDSRTHLNKVLRLEERIRSRVSQIEGTSNDFDMADFRDEIETLPPFWELVTKMILFWGYFHLDKVERMEQIQADLHPSVQPHAMRSIQLVTE